MRPSQVLQARAGPDRLAVVDGRVELLRLEVERQDARREVDRDARVRLVEGGDARDQPLRAEGRQDGEVQHAALAARGLQLEHDRLQPVEQAAQLGAEGLGRGRRPHARMLAPEERDAQALLEGTDLTADRALSAMQLLGGAREALVAQGGVEGLQGGHGGQLGSHAMSLAHAPR